MGFTSVPVKPETLARLKGYKLGGASYDDVLNELMDAHPPSAFIEAHLKSLREEERASWASVKRRQRR